MANDMLGEARLLEWFKSERNRLLWNFAEGQGPPPADEVAALSHIQAAIHAVRDLMAEGGFTPIQGTRPTSPFMRTDGGDS